MFSFYPTKNLGGAGDGGMLTTNDDVWPRACDACARTADRTSTSIEEVGINSRLDELQAAVLNVKFPHLDAWSDERAQRSPRAIQKC
jgi:dTDP-4-amino-4,6-dideoxygalactose transaminase